MIICCRLVSIGNETRRIDHANCSLYSGRRDASRVAFPACGRATRTRRPRSTGAADRRDRSACRVSSVCRWVRRSTSSCRAQASSVARGVCRAGICRPAIAWSARFPAAEQVPVRIRRSAPCMCCRMRRLRSSEPERRGAIDGGRNGDPQAGRVEPAHFTVATTDTALNSVIGQNPSSKAPIRPDRSIDLTVAGVPNVIGLSLADATSALERAHLRRGSTPSGRRRPARTTRCWISARRPGNGQRPSLSSISSSRESLFRRLFHCLSGSSSIAPRKC